MEYTGRASRDDRVVLRGDRESREFIAFWLRDDRVVAGMNVNVWDVTSSIEQLIASRAEVDLRELTDAGRPLEELAAAA
jgi:3-phenylpropionate/trans-cinnamate dioxygenase ferredoxin reductase component